MAHGADVAHRLRGCDAACKATWQGRTSPRGAQVAQTRGKGHASPRERPRGRYVASAGAGIWRAHGLVSLG